MNPEFINGPTNYVKMCGVVDGCEKEIHLFFDKHLELEDQTKCSSFNSIDIQYYLYNLIHTSSTPLDFFMEIGLGQINNKPISIQREKYVIEIIKLFKLEFNLINNKNLDIAESKTNSNVKLHWFDVRDHLDLFSFIEITSLKIKKNIKKLNKLKNNDNNSININGQ